MTPGPPGGPAPIPPARPAAPQGSPGPDWSGDVSGAEGWAEERIPEAVTEPEGGASGAQDVADSPTRALRPSLPPSPPPAPAAPGPAAEAPPNGAPFAEPPFIGAPASPTSSGGASVPPYRPEPQDASAPLGAPGAPFPPAPPPYASTQPPYGPTPPRTPAAAPQPPGPGVGSGVGGPIPHGGVPQAGPHYPEVAAAPDQPPYGTRPPGPSAAAGSATPPPTATSGWGAPPHEAGHSGTPHSGTPHSGMAHAMPTHPVPSWWQRNQRTLRATSVIVLLALCGLMILALVREQTGTRGLLVGFGLALFPVPLLLAAFRWLTAPQPVPWRTHLFAFAWGACAATLVAILANGFATDWLASSVVVDSPDQADTLGATVIAPVVEETTKAGAILLIFLFRRRHLDSVISGIAAAGITAAGFAFTENILYLGTAYGKDTVLDPDGFAGSVTAGTFVIRIVFAPFAHPLFTSMTGIALGMVAALPTRRRVLRWTLPLLGWFTGVLLHAIWNGSASFANYTFLAVYGLFMIPVFGALTWLAIWSRLHDLRLVRDTLPAYAAAGWFSEPEPWSLSSMRARSMARAMARRSHGPEAARTVAAYQHDAGALAVLRARADNGALAPDFASREHALLQRLWTNRPLAGPPTTSAALALSRPPTPRWTGYPVR
ncbi:Membrane proteinase PrsW, cleaves anti-sigma factor RsiW, M82 family [Streptomyces qinglanensis]|uniref:Membrane proteinase PrsW, cleaves anti-sigma factor RsiW, M82 family n=2 Tax=Streptomyces qinglanensis TaxID=943816 RepID=A0A1H9Q9Q5_9ACTN|nr:Membrane proteinase PrsW, cleaves anti-sigma factor RsiW, M82 family [Streptomyces qinglanensis]